LIQIKGAMMQRAGNVAAARPALLLSGEDLARTGEVVALLLRLLVEEEDKLGLTREQFREIEQQIVTIKQIINKQRETIVMLKANGHPMERAERSLPNCSIFWLCRSCIAIKSRPRFRVMTACRRSAHHCRNRPADRIP
jgi:hypothetical protein